MCSGLNENPCKAMYRSYTKKQKKTVSRNLSSNVTDTSYKIKKVSKKINVHRKTTGNSKGQFHENCTQCQVIHRQNPFNF